MPVLALGVSYRRAPVELLERLSFVDDEYSKAYRLLMDMEAVREGGILSTCNRVEVFADVTSYHAGFLDLKRFITESRDVTPDEVADPLYSHYEDDAAEHLFSVAAGIDSMVLGEPQILTQVRATFRRSEAEGASGPVLSALFRGAIRTGRRARAETAIGASPGAFVEAGADLAERELGGLAGRASVVVGAGGMAALAASHLRDRGVARIRILNRSLERARRLAARTGGPSEPGGLDVLAPAIARADIVVSCTGSAGVVIGPTIVQEAIRLNGRSAARPRFLLDLAVPRDIDPAVGEIPGICLADIDDLREVVAGRGEEVLREVDQVRAIVSQEVRRFASWRRAARLAPLIQALRDRGDRIQAAELARVAPRLSDLTDREREAVVSLARGIVGKLLHEPTVKLKDLSGPGTGDGHARLLAELFGIEFHPGP